MNCSLLLKAMAFAADKHRNQRRKDADESPYINHPIAVAALLASEAGITDQLTIIGAVLHDTVEDTEATFQELDEQFGPEVSDLVREVTDDKTLSQEERKEFQIEHAPSLSERAKQLKIADKTCNIRDIANSPPENWSAEQRRDYLSWGERVVSGCRGVNPRLEEIFDAAVEAARYSLNRADN